jgi:hypothetical protein
MTFEEGPEPNKPSDEEIRENEAEGNQSFSIVSRVNNFFGWLGDLIGQQAQVDAGIDPPAHPPISALHSVRGMQKTSEVIASAEMVCAKLEEVKARLSSEFGVTAATFISKCIDPMIDHAKALMRALQNSDHSSPVIAQAIESVELYAQFRDEKKLYRKIVQVAQGQIKQSIDKDIEILANYKQQALETSDFVENEKEEAEFQLDRFFVWKNNVDERRNSLVELGLLTIDSLRGSANTSLFVSDDEGEEVLIEEPLADFIKHHLEDSSLAMSFLSSLEDRLNQVFTRLELADFQDEQSLDEATTLLEHIKVDSERLAELSRHTQRVLDNFKTLRESILSAEALINRRKSGTI